MVNFPPWMQHMLPKWILIAWSIWALLCWCAPRVMIQVIALLWPRGRDRDEQIAEVRHVKALERPLWLLNIMFAGLVEGIPRRSMGMTRDLTILQFGSLFDSLRPPKPQDIEAEVDEEASRRVVDNSVLVVDAIMFGLILAVTLPYLGLMLGVPISAAGTVIVCPQGVAPVFSAVRAIVLRVVHRLSDMRAARRVLVARLLSTIDD